MGNCCCPAAGHCDSLGERSGLLEDPSKATLPAADTGPEGAVPDRHGANDDVRKRSDEIQVKKEESVVTVQVKLSPQVRERELSKTRENGAPLKEQVQPSPSKGNGLEQSSTNKSPDKKLEEVASISRPIECLQCTLETSQVVERASSDEEQFAKTKVVLVDELPAAAPDKTPEGILQESDAVSLENLMLRTAIPKKHSTPEMTHDDINSSLRTTENAEASFSGNFSHCNEETSLSDAQLHAETCQISPISMACQEAGTESTLIGSTLQPPSPSESPNCAVTNESQLENGSSSGCKDDHAEKTISPDVSKPSPGLDFTALKPNAVEQEPADLFREPETTDPPEANKSLVQDVEEMEAKPAVRDPIAEEEKEIASSDVMTKAVKEGEILDLSVKEEVLATSTSDDMEVKVVPVTEQDCFAEDAIGNSDEDLYRGAEELSSTPAKRAALAPLLEITPPKLEDRCGLSPAVDILSYCEREWKGNTAKSALIRKGYKEMSQRFGSLRRVRGDNYCALRATLFQVLCHTTRLPDWLQEEDIATLPVELETRDGLISQWIFPGECQQGDGTMDATQHLKGYVELFRNTWLAAVGCSNVEERQSLCEQVFQGREEELGLLEALKLLMLGQAVELHSRMQTGGDVPVFCWLLFARDSSECPRTFLSNHLCHVGFSGGLEQVEMFLLGYTLQCTIQVYRLYLADTEEFVTYYPDDHKEDWPSVCLVTEDDRHYNVPVEEAAEPTVELATS
ncbi:uncharacterized protein LOC130129577 [Lampris incognitus]|uniref:uncharacterized protein LOC130129577 n=1 Tax=Lampris incognitus TaxID=2546036 RepID=UPI0024B5E30E|nr:uncharacterized protein LOC130129577 [Lampris incognitus]XP_056155141.1 uncharacterized protein LOC130129577 [Lampris incognitus]